MKKMFKGLIFISLLIFVFASLFVGNAIYKRDVELNQTRDIYNLTNNLKLNYSCDMFFNNSLISLPEIKINRLNRIFCSFGDFVITSGIEITKFGIEFGYENPQYDYEWYIKFLKLYLFALISFIVIPLIIPFIALIYLLIVGINNLFIWIKRKRK